MGKAWTGPFLGDTPPLLPTSTWTRLKMGAPHSISFYQQDNFRRQPNTPLTHFPITTCFLLPATCIKWTAPRKLIPQQPADPGTRPVGAPRQAQRALVLLAGLLEVPGTAQRRGEVGEERHLDRQPDPNGPPRFFFFPFFSLFFSFWFWGLLSWRCQEKIPLIKGKGKKCAPMETLPPTNIVGGYLKINFLKRPAVRCHASGRVDSFKATTSPLRKLEQKAPLEVLVVDLGTPSV